MQPENHTECLQTAMKLSGLLGESTAIIKYFIEILESVPNYDNLIPFKKTMICEKGETFLKNVESIMYQEKP